MSIFGLGKKKDDGSNSNFSLGIKIFKYLGIDGFFLTIKVFKVSVKYFI